MFSGSILDYPLFQKNWKMEVFASSLPEAIELIYLKSSIPVSDMDR